MCTATWWRPPGSDTVDYTVFFNRDERITREAALPPTERARAGVRFLAPTDPDGGGTWLLVSQFGVTAGLLNHYAAGQAPREPPRNPTSRGLLVESLAPLPSAPAVRDALEAMELGVFRPFLVFALDRMGGSMAAVWDAGTLRFLDPIDARLPLTTSSYQSARVIAARRRRFDALGDHPGENALVDYHHARDPDDPAASVRMARDDARTVSFSRIRVGGTMAEFHYEPDTGKPTDAMLPLA